jgi:hypothetical protein
MFLVWLRVNLPATTSRANIGQVPFSAKRKLNHECSILFPFYNFSMEFISFSKR